jgi:hypothetical protein
VLARVPARLSPEQTFLVVLVGGLVLVALVGGLLLEMLVGGGVSAVLRMMGVQRPTKSRARTAIDEFEARVRGSGAPDPPKPPL